MDSALVEKFQWFFRTEFNRGTHENPIIRSYYDDLLELDSEYPEKSSIDVLFWDIRSFDIELADDILNNPIYNFEHATEAISQLDFPFENRFEKVEIRIIKLPETETISISKIRNNHEYKLISIPAVISKISQSSSKVTEVAFQCLRCGHITTVDQDGENDYVKQPHFGCENDTCGKNGPWKRIKEGCKSENFQNIKLQESLEDLRGRQPQFLFARCYGDLVGTLQPGEKVLLTGVLTSRLKEKKDKQTVFNEIMFVVNSVVKSTRDYENIIITPDKEKKILEISKSEDLDEIMVSSMCPSIYGHENVKHGLLLQHFSSGREYKPDGTSTRGDIHILLIGDPGVAKSQMMSYSAKLNPIWIMLTGDSTTAAGLTGAAVHDPDFDGGKWSIEAGAMTRANRGICAFDEVDKMRPSDRAAIHTALEQQFVDVAKAGLYAHMPTECAFLGAANPKYGRFDRYEQIDKQFNLPPTLLTRMDLVFVLQDIANPEFDEKLAMHVLGLEIKAKPILDQEFLREYIAYARTNFHPILTDETKEYIKNFYTSTRGSSKGKEAVPITVRFLESAKRLCIAQARTRLSNEVSLQDAKKAISLLIGNLREIGIDPDTGELDAAIQSGGFSNSQRQKMKFIRETISSLSKKNLTRGTANLTDILTKCSEKGITNTEFFLKRMSEKGDIFSPDGITYKLVE